MVSFLHLHLHPIQFELKFLDLPCLLLGVAIFALSDGLELSHFVV